MLKFARTARTFLVSKGTLAASTQTLLINVAVLAINMLTGIATARFMGPTGRGEQEAMGLWPQFLAYAFTFGLPSALIYRLRKTPEEASKIFTASFLASLAAGMLAVAFGYIMIPIWLRQHSEFVVQGAIFLLWFTPLVMLDDVLASALRAKGDFTRYNSIRFLQPAVTLVALLVLGTLDLLTPFTACLCYLIPNLPISVWLAYRFWQLHPPIWTGLRPTFSSLTSYGFRSYGIDLLSVLSTQIDKALVVGLLSASSLGLYVVSLSLASMLGIFQGAAVTVLFPHASGLSVKDATELAGQAARLSLAITLVCAIILAVIGPWALEFLYGPEFRGGAHLMRLLILVSVIEGTASVLAQAFMATDRPGIITIRQGLSLALNLPLLALFIPQFGLIGAALSLIITSLVRLIFTMVSFPQVLKVPAPRLWLNYADIKDIMARVQHHLHSGAH